MLFVDSEEDPAGGEPPMPRPGVSAGRAGGGGPEGRSLCIPISLICRRGLKDAQRQLKGNLITVPRGA